MIATYTRELECLPCRVWDDWEAMVKRTKGLEATVKRLERALVEIAGYDETGIPSFIPAELARRALSEIKELENARNA